jgi:hypothetical protein
MITKELGQVADAPSVVTAMNSRNQEKSVIDMRLFRRLCALDKCGNEQQKPKEPSPV